MNIYSSKVLRYGLFLWLTVYFSSTVSGQLVDTLILKNTNSKGIVDIASLLAQGNVLMHSDPQAAMELARKAIVVSEKQKDPLDLANSFRYQGACFAQVKTNFDSAFFYFDRAEQLYWRHPSTTSTVSMGRIQHNSGTIRQTQGDYGAAMNHYIQALRLFDEVNDMKTRPYTLNNLSALYSTLNNLDKAEKYARQCLALSRDAGNALLVATSQNNLGDILMSKGEYERALPLFQEVLKYGEKHNDPNKKFSYYFNHGEYYLYHEKKYDLAVQEFERAKQIVDSLGQDWNLRDYNSALSQAYLLNEEYERAYEAAEKSLQSADLQGAKGTRQVGLSVLAQANAHMGKHKEAYQQMHEAYLLKDTVFNEDSRRHIAFLEAEYQTEKKELKIASLEKQKQLYTWLGVAIAVILFVALAFAFIRYRLAVNRRKLAEEEARRLEQEKQLVAVQATLDGEAAERTRLAKDLHDGLGSMLSLVKFNLPPVTGDAAVLETIDVSRFQKAIGMLDDSIQELRRVAHHMMPESLLRYGLKASLTDFCSAIPIADFHYFGNEARLPEKMEIMIYRCIHELVNNALKHAQANHINVQLVQEEDRISFTVQDDGKGFDQQQVTEGMGLKNVRQRVAAFQGDVHIYSSAQGTEIHVELEFEKKGE